MFNFTLFDMLLILFIAGPMYFWYIYLSILMIGVMLIYSNRKKNNTENKILYWIGMILTAFIVINCICTLFFMLSYI